LISRHCEFYTSVDKVLITSNLFERKNLYKRKNKNWIEPKWILKELKYSDLDKEAKWEWNLVNDFTKIYSYLSLLQKNSINAEKLETGKKEDL